MKKKIALITGVSGQDGAYLAELLLNKNYRVIGADRRSARDDKWRLRKLGIEKKVEIEDFELGEINHIFRIFNKYKFDEVYNMAAQSFVATSFSNPITTADVTGIVVLRILEVIKNLKKKPKFYQASSSEWFGGKPGTAPQDESTPFHPRSPYAVAKLYAYWISVNSREAFNIFACNGILFNHESPRRGETFVTKKITKAVANISKGKQEHLSLGNLDAKRDWGFAGDFVEAMWLMLQQNKADDFVIATGETHTVREFLNETFRLAGLSVSKHVEINLVALHKELDNDGLKAIEQNASESVKRVISQPSLEGLSSILPYLETKTVWHPKGT